MVKGVETMQVTNGDLERHQEGKQPQRHRQHLARLDRGTLAPKIIRGYTDDDEAGRHQKGCNSV